MKNLFISFQQKGTNYFRRLQEKREKKVATFAGSHSQKTNKMKNLFFSAAKKRTFFDDCKKNAKKSLLNS